MKKTKEQISFNMRRVKNKDSAIELALRKELWNRGLRYRKNVKSVCGKPDIAFIGKKIAVFCDSEFWHGYAWEIAQDEFQSRRDFWIPKIERNMQRDREVTASLESAGWTVLRFWEFQIKKELDSCVETICKTIVERRAE